MGIILSFLFWTWLQKWFSPWISRRYFAERYAKLIEGAKGQGEEAKKLKKKLVDWDARIPGFLHGALASALSIYCCFYDEAMMADPLRATSNAWLVTVSVAAGFFAWDLYLCVSHFSVFGMEFVIHASFCLVTYLICGYVQEHPFAWHASSLLMFELSTPFLHSRWAMIEFKWDPQLITYFTYMFAAAFFVARILWGNFYAFPLIWRALVYGPKIPVWQAGMFWFNSILSAMINTYWMIFIIKSGMKGKRKKKDA
eukprot:CAMPEP_0197515864 /NCGR_PEP_ID=MMETSP1318-20131121/848_1 /TAXON_ID=552666 /ORGANISM="Partenskyella glossopodia, Strain RCC365" /LENGTH=254 /DNA_ID=CAMNT_0043064335 /DNA_START=173 /DNA_END=937 /DNA_ORIENTATION=-